MKPTDIEPNRFVIGDGRLTRIESENPVSAKLGVPFRRYGYDHEAAQRAAPVHVPLEQGIPRPADRGRAEPRDRADFAQADAMRPDT